MAKAVVIFDAIGWRDDPDDIRTTRYADLGEDVELPSDEFGRLSDAGAIAKPGTDEAEAAKQKAADQESRRLRVETTAPDANLRQPTPVELADSMSTAPHADPSLPPADTPEARAAVQAAIKALPQADDSGGGGFSDMTVEELDAYADEHGVEGYQKSAKKSEKIDALEASLEAESAPVGDQQED